MGLGVRPILCVIRCASSRYSRSASIARLGSTLFQIPLKPKASIMATASLCILDLNHECYLWSNAPTSYAAPGMCHSPSQPSAERLGVLPREPSEARGLVDSNVESFNRPASFVPQPQHRPLLRQNRLALQQGCPLTSPRRDAHIQCVPNNFFAATFRLGARQSPGMTTTIAPAGTDQTNRALCATDQQRTRQPCAIDRLRVVALSRGAARSMSLNL